MSVIVTTQRGTEVDSIHFHNGFGWFLDSIFGGEELPKNFFTQAIAPCDSEPGPLSPAEAHGFAAAVGAMTDDELENRMWAALNGRESDDAGMGPAIKTVREIAQMADQGHGLITR